MYSKVRRIIFIHGWASGPEIWQRQKEYFAQYYKVTLPGIGAATNIKEAAQIVNAAIQDKKDFFVVGWSLGWLVVLELLKNFNISPRGLVAVNSTPKLIDDGYLGVGPTKTHLAKMIRDCKRNPQKTFEEFYENMLTDEARNMLSAVNRLKNSDYEKLVYGLYILRDNDYRDFLKEIRIPTLLIAGSKDVICPKEASGYMQTAIQGARLEILDCGHMPFLDKPEEFNSIVEDFVKGLE